MKALYFIVLILFIAVLFDITVGSESPTEDGTERSDIDDDDNNNNVTGTTVLPSTVNIPVLSDAIAVLDDSDDCEYDSLTNENETLSAVLDHTDGGNMGEHSDDDVTTTTSNEPSDVGNDDDSLIQINPEYVGKSESDNDDKDTCEESSKNFNNEDSKSKIGAALGSGTNGQPQYKTIRQFVQRHRVKITIALVVIAFRREIRQAIWGMISRPVHDPHTGQEMGRRRIQPIRPTSILKILLFIHAVRQLQRIRDGNSNTSENTNPLSPALLLFTGPFSTFVAWFVSDMLSTNKNPAYLPPTEQHYTFERINHRYTIDVQAYTKAILDEKVVTTPLKIQQFLSTHRHEPNTTNKERAHIIYERLFQQGDQAKRITTAATSTPTSYNSTIVIMDWTDLDSSLSKLDTLRDEVSFLIRCYDGCLNVENSQSSYIFEVVILLESPGGSASEYALAAQQILRLRQSGISVTICVDKVAASGGYMIACTSTPGQLYAAPFAVLGSIGVIGQAVNVHKLLEGWGITPLVFRGGKDKAPVGLIGEVTKAGMNKVQIMVDDTHRAFKRHVAESRPIIAHRINEIATGDIWLGYDALDIGLVDRVVTSDEYLGERLRSGARLLKLLKIVRGRSLFSKPQTELLSQWNALGCLNNRKVLDFISVCRTLLNDAQTALGTFLCDDLSTATRTPNLCHAQLSSSS